MLKKLSEEKLEEIIRVGIDEFSNVGFQKTSMNAIAKKADISVGVLYKYFENKEDLFEKCLEGSINTLDHILHCVLSKEGEPIDRVRDILLQLIHFSKEHSQEIIMYHEITGSSYSHLAEEMAERIEGISATLYHEYLASLQEKGVVKSSLSPKLGAFFFDNLLMMLQFSYSVPYYKKRMEIYCGEDAFEDDQNMVNGLVTFIGNAFRS